MDIDIKIIGPGCIKCLEAANTVRVMAKEHGLLVQIDKIGNTERIAEFGVLLTPAVVVDGDMKCAGQVPLASLATISYAFKASKIERDKKAAEKFYRKST